MQEEQATTNGEKGSIDPLEAYHILLQRQTNEDRILLETTSIFLAATSFLFLAFVMLIHLTLVPTFNGLRIILPILGMGIAFWTYLRNLPAANALRFWHSAQQKIEETEEELFDYMLKNEITPHVHARKAIRGIRKMEKTEDGKWEFKQVTGFKRLLNKPLQWDKLRPVYQFYLPAVIFVLWLVSLILAIISCFN